jgi:carbamoyl-phosphate synthase large subunit
MPKRQDLKTILLIGSGAIRVGQACEFDYSGTQACLSLKEEGYSVILLNDNPASVMTDYDIADHTYIAPITVASAEAILKKHRPCAILPTMGGQTALNLVLELQSKDLLNRYDVEIIGAAIDAIEKGEDRHLFAQVLLNNSIAVLPSHRALCWQDVNDCISELGFPVIVRTSFSLAGANSIVAYDQHELSLFCHRMFSEGAVLSIAPMLKGWKEFEFEVLRDASGNCFSVCCIENIDPMGIHTGDSITVTPSITLDDMMYQTLRKTAFAVIEHIGICGGANVQFALEPATGFFYVIEMNPRVSRSSALASKATSFPIAKVAAKLAVGCTLDEIDECRIEPTLDFFAVKIIKLFKNTTEINRI